ncbi:isochorismatase family hydrolase [Penicillium argentinense]|uniref:nicotinamidase n=1 Tax=Penicillium argentinense TaxID=1131581 RepID=A0A9W9FP95_9EURO|nr:isochorismatase family hydrolase [Penicillium argentinense]KAJ5103840.1 isochorismatase family hydrolase [Penicillium argentinense]
MGSIHGGAFVPALIVVDMQEDFCPPTGSLAVQDGRTIAPLINTLLAQPGFVARVATLDWHPTDHISFASNHPAPNNKPFESFIEMQNPAPGKETEIKLQQLWPVHCVADSPGAAIIPEIESNRVDLLVYKGKHSQVEMYSAIADAFGNLDPAVTAQSVNMDLISALRAKGVTDVFVVGLAGDYCVKCTAVDAVKAGFRSWLIEEGTKCVVPAGWDTVKEELRAAGVSVIHADDAVMRKLAVASS